MGIWFTALKAIPWADVIAAAPAVTKGARKLFKRAQETPVLDATGRAGDAPSSLQALEAAVAQLLAQQQASAALIDSLAAQNGQIVEAIEILRVRTRLLGWLVAGLALALVAALGLSAQTS